MSLYYIKYYTTVSEENFHLPFGVICCLYCINITSIYKISATFIKPFPGDCFYPVPAPHPTPPYHRL